MTQEFYSKDFKAQQELKSAGLTPESINAIQNTTVITRDGAQHVVPNSQKHLDQGQSRPAQENNTVVGDQNTDQLSVQLQEQHKMFTRYKNYSEQRITKLEIALSQAIEKLNEMSQTVTTLKSNAQAQSKREEVYAKQNNGGGEVAEKPIDRNNVAPSDVQVDKIFYCGTR